MASYYYTAEDRELADSVAMELRERLVYEQAAKRGKHWRLDGEVRMWNELIWFFAGHDADFPPPYWEGRAKALVKYPRALAKLGNSIPFHGFLALLRERLDYWQSEQAPF